MNEQSTDNMYFSVLQFTLPLLLLQHKLLQLKSASLQVSLSDISNYSLRHYGLSVIK